MTERLYYRDPFETTFQAEVVAVDASAPERVLVRLDRTAFYPTSGGQPFDTGMLAGCRVIDVFDATGAGGDEVVHVVEGAPPAIGQAVEGTIDWPRRFDHMQQHTGQHMLSASFVTVCEAHTVSFHMGAEVSTIDLSRAVSPEEIAAAEADANRIVRDDRPVAIRFVTDAEAAALPLRKPPAKTGTIRLIEVEGHDLSACGGTHVGRTGAIGVIAVSGWERFKGGVRVEFVCGGRALGRFRSLRDAASVSTRALSISIAELPEVVQRLLEDAKRDRRTIAALQTELAKYEGAQLAAEAQPIGAVRLVAKAANRDAAGLKALATAATANPGVAAVLVSTTAPALVVVARSADVSLRANDVLAALVAAFGGRGGGKPDLAQGGGLNAPADAILDEARRLIAGDIV